MKKDKFYCDIREINGKKWIFGEGKYQCAYCLYQQPTVVSDETRDENGFVESFLITVETEQHSEDCKQK